MSSSNCCFLTCIQTSQEAGQMVWYSHLFQNFPEFIVIHTVKGFGIVSKVEIDVFLKLSCFLYDPTDVGNLISGSSAFSKTSLNIWKFTVLVCWSLAWRILSITLLACEMSAFFGNSFLWDWNENWPFPVLWPLLSFKPTFLFFYFTFIKRLFSSSSLSAIRVVSSAYLRLLIFLLAILFSACVSSSPAFLMMYSA